MTTNRPKKSKKKLGRNRRLGKRRRGSGNRGGVGRAGTGKRQSQKGKRMEKKKGFVCITSKKQGIVNLDWISTRAKGDRIELPGKKVLSKGELKKPITIKARSFSKKAEEKIKKVGGKIEHFR